MLSLQPDGELDSVADKMTKALDNVKTGEITVATRSVEIDGVKVPFQVKSTSVVQSLTVTLTKVEHNGTFDQLLFSKPAN